MLWIASFNVENLFECLKAFDTAISTIGKPALNVYREVPSRNYQSQESGTE